MRARAWTAAALAGLAFGAAPGAAQFGNGALALRFDSTPLDGDAFPRPPLHLQGRYVVIRLAENRVYVMDGAEVRWTAPVATGTGFRVEGGGQAWHFATPRGAFRVQRKETDPVWIMPDWAFVEAGRPVPPLDSPLRRRKGMLGTSAVYIGYQLALHGTNRPDLVLNPDPEDRRVSHGCIRLTNEDARTLYHLVDVGTPVLIY